MGRGILPRLPERFIMKKVIFLSLLFCFVLLGCRTVSDSLKQYDACKGDPVCVQSMLENKQIASVVVEKVVDTNTQNSSLGWILGSIVGNIVAFATGVSRGKKLLKKEI